MDPLSLLRAVEDYVTEMGSLLAVPEPGQLARSYELLELTDELEIWLIQWPTEKGLELHDHGGSAGALWVLRGLLDEHALDADWQPCRRSIAAGGGISFGPSYVHDVVNRGTEPATSVHAYSPPMTSMNFYRQQGVRLHVERSEHRSTADWTP